MLGGASTSHNVDENGDRGSGDRKECSIRNTKTTPGWSTSDQEPGVSAMLSAGCALNNNRRANVTDYIKTVYGMRTYIYSPCCSRSAPSIGSYGTHSTHAENKKGKNPKSNPLVTFTREKAEACGPRPQSPARDPSPSLWTVRTYLWTYCILCDNSARTVFISCDLHAAAEPALQYLLPGTQIVVG